MRALTGLATPFMAFAPADAARSAPLLSPINRRRLENFKRNRRGYISFVLFVIIFGLTLCAEVLINDKPIVAMYKGELLFPAFVKYPDRKFGGLLAVPNYRLPRTQAAIEREGWMVWPPVRYSYATVDKEIAVPNPSPPSWLLAEEKRCERYPQGVTDPNCNLGNWHWLGTDDEGRDVLARLVYGFRISVLFGLTLTVISSIIGIAAGAIQGYFGGWTDLLFQRFLDIWTSIPSLYLLLIVSAVLTPSFWVLLGILLLFSWVALVSVVRAEFLRGRNLEYIAAARALGVSNLNIMRRHLLPNAMVATMTFLPFILAGSVTTLTALDFLGFGLPPNEPSLGELLSQGKEHIGAPWLGLTGFFVIAVMLSLLVFTGEAVRDAFDPRKTFR